MNRIAFNITITYLGSLVSIGLALFSSRWVLNALGKTDFGLFSVVGSLIIFLTFFNTVMANSAARHFAFAIGKGDEVEINNWFNASLKIHVVIPVFLILIGWPIAEYAIRHILTIPSERIDVCVLVFRISLVGAFVNMVSIPFVAMFTAKQYIAELSYLNVLQMVMVFLLSWSILNIESDRLLFYASGVVGIHVLISLVKIVIANIIFNDCKIKIFEGYNIHRIRKLFNFAMWSLIGNTGATISKQGSEILLNMYYGPTLNAAFSIAHKLSTNANLLSNAMVTTFIPEITTKEGQGDHSRVILLSHFSSKTGYILILLFAIPLIAEINYILKIWLINPPDYTDIFCKWILATFLADKLTNGCMMAVNARGKIAAYQITIGGILLLNIPLAIFFFKCGYSPGTLGLALFVTAVICSFSRVLWLRKLFNEPINNWVYMVFVPCLIITIGALIASFLSCYIFQPSFIRLIITSFFCLIITVTFSFFFGFNSFEKSVLYNSINEIILKLLFKIKKKSVIKNAK